MKHRLFFCVLLSGYRYSMYLFNFNSLCLPFIPEKPPIFLKLFLRHLDHRLFMGVLKCSLPNLLHITAFHSNAFQFHTSVKDILSDWYYIFSNRNYTELFIFIKCFIGYWCNFIDVSLYFYCCRNSRAGEVFLNRLW